MRIHGAKPARLRRWLGAAIVSIPFFVMAGSASGQAPHDDRALAGEWMEHLGYAPTRLPDGDFARFPGVPAPNVRAAALGTDVELGGWESPGIAINPADPMNIAVCTFLSLRISTDGGATFGAPVLPTGTGQAWGPMAVTFDSQGRLFWAYRDISRTPGDAGVIGTDVVVARCDPVTGAILPGYPVNVTVDAGVPGSLGSDNDMPWIVADVEPTSVRRDRLYITWTRFQTNGKTRIHTTYSTDQGLTWSIQARLDGPDLMEGLKWPSHATVAPNGDLYVAYHTRLNWDRDGQVLVRRSTDGGSSFLPSTAAFAPGEAGVTFNGTGGGRIPGTSLNLQGCAQPWILADPLTAGRVYVVAADDPGTYDPTDPANDPADVMLAISTDYGLTWGTPARIDSGPAPTFQVMPTAAIDPVSGHIAVRWYDSRGGNVNGDGDWLLDTYMAVSEDGGLTFLPDVQVNDLPIDVDAGAPCVLQCGNQLLGVWGSSSTDVIAVGRGGMILRWDGSAWTQETSGVSAHLWDVWGSAADDVWVVGQSGRILHWNGSSWDTGVTSPTTSTLYGLWGNAADDIFAVGISGTIIHWDGSVWSVQTSGTTNGLLGVWGSAADNVLAVGLDGTALRYDGSTWAPEPGLSTTDWLWAIWGSSASDITVVSTTDGDVHHYDGSSWSVTGQLPPWSIDLHGFAWDDMTAVGVDNCHWDGSGWCLTGATPEFRRAWGPATNDVFVVGTGGVIWHFDGASWSPMDSPVVSSGELLEIGPRSGIAVVNDVVYSVWCGNWRYGGAARGVQTILDRGATAVPAGPGGRPGVSALTLDPGAPNPFGARSRISYALPQAGHVTLVLHDVMGRRVATLVDRWEPAGRHALEWDATDLRIAAGVYFLRLESQGETAVQRIVRLR